MNYKTVYVQQYDFFWKFTLDEWIAFVEAYLKDPADGYVLPDANALKIRSPAIGFTDYDGGGRKSYFPRDSANVLLVEPLDWDEETFREHLKELKERP